MKWKSHFECDFGSHFECDFRLEVTFRCDVLEVILNKGRNKNNFQTCRTVRELSRSKKKKIVNFFLIDFAISFPSRNLQYQAWIDHVKVHHRRSKNGPGGIRAKSLETLLCRAVFQSSRAGPKQPGYFGRLFWPCGAELENCPAQ